ncbi:MAG: acyl-ACP--UDP-N-acetylglucosamine O-acyltransferase [Acidobacteriota bacterium]|jgi:UDP-N-acetylglucosamine acyltransferase|nr:acyl-ACP--UDP-N-acetylglucosamine O-acyltransferase [Acidobacteriota bacterium]
MTIHPTAIVDSSCEISADAQIGPYCVIGPHTQIAAGSILDSHVTIQGWTTIGERCHFFSHCSAGADPQDLKYKGETTWLRIGHDNVFREFVSMHRGTLGGHGVTVIGNHNFIMAYAHIAHDCVVGDHVIMANAATLAGHVDVADHAQVGAFSAVHQFCRVGPHAFIGGFSVVTRDALPFIKTVGARNEAKIYGINTLGLQRKGFSAHSIEELKKFYRICFRSQLNTGDALAKAKEIQWTAPEVSTLIEFMESSQRGFIR